MDQNNSNTLRWRFDVNTFRLLGRELITDRITAVFELVKNCYDANSKNVYINFIDVGKKSSNSKIIITDDGTGMSFDDIRDKWMVVGTASKRSNIYSAPPFNRRLVGEKGIGRFAVDKLGGKLVIKTKTELVVNNEQLHVEINWEEYEELAKGQQLTLFTEIDNFYKYEKSEINPSGTILEISAINEIWTQTDINRLYKELTKIVSPFYPLNPPFNIYISSNEHKDYTKKKVELDVINFASHYAEVNFDEKNNKQDVLRFNNKTGKIVVDKVETKIFGPIKMKLYYFDNKAKKKYNSVYKGDENRIDGVKIYRDGLITTPFAEFEEHPDRKRDILGIDKRLWRDIFNRISTREVIGIVEITKEGNSLIIDSTNRQDFVDNEEYRLLKRFIIEQLNIFSELKIYERDNNKVTTTKALEKAGQDVKLFEKAIAELEEITPELKTILEPLKQQAKEINTSISKGISEQKKSEQEFIRRENIYLSLMSLQDYAVNISHAVRTSLGKVKQLAEFFKNEFPNSKYDLLFKEYALMIFEEMTTLNKVIDFMLSYAGSNLDFEDINIKDLLETLIYKSYKPSFEADQIKPIVEIKDNFIVHTNKKFFEDVFQNLIANSQKALQNKQDKIIKCTGYIEDNNFICLFSDNGIGVPNESKEKIFELYYTTTAEQGGAGLGLFIVKTRIEALRGKIEVIDNELQPTGTTFKITLPFEQNT